MTTKRSRRHAREERGIPEDSKRWQLLLFGMELVPDGSRGFESQAEELAAFRDAREQLMKAALPGQRPAAFFKFELGIPSPALLRDQLPILLSRGLITDGEAQQLERDNYELLTADFGGAFHTVEGVRAMRLGMASLRSMVARFDTLAAWHQRRGRPEIATTYRTRSKVCRDVLLGVIV